MDDDVALFLALCMLCVILIVIQIKKVEHFAASQGGALQQLNAGHVASEEEVTQMREYNKKIVVRDILNMTEPERNAGPLPAYR